MAAGTWKIYNTFKQRALNAAADLEKSIKIQLVTSSYTPSFAHLLLTTTTIASNKAANCSATTPSGLDTYTSGEASLVATNNDYRFDIAATSVFTATGGSIVAKYAILAEATDNQLIGYVDLATGTASGVTVTAGNTLTISFPTSGIFLLSGGTT